MPERFAVLAEVVRSRRTINDFLPERPPDDTVQAAIELARWAPNHKLTQPWRFHLLGEQTAAAVVELNARLVAASKGAEAAESKRRKWSAVPGWLVVTCLRSSEPLRQREDYAACCCAVQNLLLALWAQGIGSKWTTGDVTRDPAFLRLLGVDPQAQDVVGLISYGYPSGVAQSRRSALQEIIVQHP